MGSISSLHPPLSPVGLVRLFFNDKDVDAMLDNVLCQRSGSFDSVAAGKVTRNVAQLIAIIHVKISAPYFFRVVTNTSKVRSPKRLHVLY